LCVLDSHGRLAFETDLVELPEEDGEGNPCLRIPAGQFTPGRYILLLTGAEGEAKGVEEVYVLSDDRADRLSARDYIHSPLPLTNHLGDIDRVLEAFRAGHYNSLMRTSWARETSSAQITDDYRLLPYHLLHADFLGIHGMTADIEFLSVGGTPESRNPRIARKGTMEYAVTEEGVAQREPNGEGKSLGMNEEEFQRLQKAYRKGLNWQGRETGVCPQDDLLLERRERVYNDILANYYDKPGMGNIIVAHKPGTYRLPSCFCEACQKQYIGFLRRIGYTPEMLGKAEWEEVRLPAPDAFEIDEASVNRFLEGLGITKEDADSSGEVLWVGLPGNLGKLTGYAQDFRDMAKAGLKLTPREWVAVNRFAGYQLTEELRRLKKRLLAKRPDFRWSVEMAHPSVELGSNLAMMPGNAWDLSRVIDHLSISAGISGPGLWYDGYFNCYCAEVLGAALNHTGPFSLTLHQDEIGVLGIRIRSGHFYDLCPEQFKEWVASCIAHGAEGIGLDNCSTPHQIWMYDRSCPSGRGEVGPAFEMLETLNGSVGPSLRRAYGERSAIAILYSYSRLLRYASSDTFQGFKFLHRGFGGGGVSFIHEDQVLKGGLGGIKALFIFGDGQCIDEDLAETIREWVQGGGLLVADIHTGRWDRDLTRRDWFADIFGCDEGGEPDGREIRFDESSPEEGSIALISPEEHGKLSPPERCAGKVWPERLLLLPHGEEDVDVLARWDDGSPAIVSHTFGEGKAILAGLFLGQEAYFLSEEDQDKLSRFLAGLCLRNGITPPGWSEDPNYEVGVRNGGKDVKYAVVHMHLSQHGWRPREGMVLHSWMEEDPTWERLPQLRFRPKDERFPTTITFQGSWFIIDVMSGETIPGSVEDGNTLIQEALRLGEIRVLALMRRKPASIEISSPKRPVVKGTRAAFKVSFLDEAGKVVSGCVPFELRIEDGQGRVVLSRFTSTDPSGEGNVELSIGQNSSPGTWRVSASSPMLGLCQEAKLEIVGQEPHIFTPRAGSQKGSRSRGDVAAVEVSGEEVLLENGLVLATLRPSSMSLRLRDKRTGRIFQVLGERLLGHLVDANGLRRVSERTLASPSSTSVSIDAQGPVTAKVRVKNTYRDLLVREWILELDASSPNLRVHSSWRPLVPLGPEDGEANEVNPQRAHICLGTVQAEGGLTTVESFMQMWQNARVENYRIFQRGMNKDAQVDYKVSRTPTLPPSSDWGKPTPLDAGFYTYPQRSWFDISTEDSGITVVASLLDAVDSRGIHIQRFGAIGFSGVTYRKGLGEAQWRGRSYPRIAKSVPRETVCYKELSFSYVFAPHSGGCADRKGQIVDDLRPGELPPLDIYTSLCPRWDPGERPSPTPGDAKR